ncbi:MAG: hypothetical protein IJ349_09945 [Clostridia bacterium]|nr:hypothetical protein [Clostridia bacterium]
MKYGLIGEKLGHSFSKPIHEKIGGYEYEIKEIAAQDLDGFMKERAFSGINVTIPYKTQVIPYLDYIDPIAEKIGAVNTISNRVNRLYGYNTDFFGMKMLVEKQGFDFTGKKVVVLGSGGTSRTAVAVCESLGAKEIVVVSRKGEVNYSNLYTFHADADYIINTTPVGMYPDNLFSPVDLSFFKKLKGVTDVVYNPLKTRLCLEAVDRGIKAEGGLYMLVAQAVFACEKFLDSSLDIKKVTDEVFGEILSEKRNIVLIGMPGSGKTTIGKALSERTGKSFIDTDEMIAETHGVISDIFAQKGEEYFRELEAEKVKEASLKNGTVIATGGGAVLRRENIEALRQNGDIFFLNRPLEDIIPTADRPLSSDRAALEKRFKERYDIYKASADYEIQIDGNVENAVSRIMEKLR